MNRLTKSLLVGLLEQENYTTAFYGGEFKPPTKGHFAVVKKSLEQFPDIDKFYIVIGKGIRDGISQDESYSVWNIYKKYLGDKIEIIKADSSPLKYVKDYIKENTNHKSLVLIGSREESDEDAQDFVKRKEFFDQYGSHVEVKNIITSGGVSGTKAREAAKISKEQFFQYVPSELTDEEKNLIFTYVQSVIQEQAIKKVANKAKELGKNFSQAFKDQKGDFKGFRSLVLRHLTKQNLTPEEKEKLKRNLIDILKTSGIAITFPVLGASGNVLLGWLTSKLTKGKFTTLPSKFKDQLLDHQILEILSGVNLTQPLNENATYSSSIDYKQKIVDLTNYMRKKGYKIDPLPKVEFKNGDEENAKNFFGKTAYYDPNTMTIYLYTEGRHPKDIVRSFSHEMIHHIQNLEDRLGNITTQNTSEDDHLDRIEREAYLNGNITFRNWTDSLNENVSPFSMDIKESILSDIKEYGNILEFQIDLTNTYQYSFNSNVGEFYDDINNVKVIVKLKPTTKNIPEFKFYSLQDDNQVSFNKLKHYNPKVMNTIFKIFMDKVLPENPKVLIQPFDYLRYRLFRAMLNNNLDGKNYKVDTKDDPMGQSILLVQKLNESKKPYKHKHGFDDKLGKDPFGLNQFAREIMQELEGDLGEGRKKKKDPKVGTGKKPKGSGRRLYTDEDPTDTVKIKFSTKQDIIDTLNKASFKNKSHARQSQIINLIHQRVRAAYERAKDPDVKERLKIALDYAEERKEASKKKTQRLNKQKIKEGIDTNFDKIKFYYDYFTNVSPSIFNVTIVEDNIVISGINNNYSPTFNDQTDIKQLPINQNLEENIDPKAQSKHKGKSSPFGSAYKPLKEGRYDKLSNQVSSKIFNYWKNNLDPTIDIDEEQVVEYKFPITFQNLTFDVETKLILDPGVDKFEILDSTGAGTDKGGDFINVHFRTDPERLPKEWEFISMMIKDVIRHEIEHLTHNVGAKSNIKLKSLEDDSLIRKAIKAKLLPQAEYFKLTKEIDAMLQGMYFRAKKSKQPFSKILSDYLDIQDITSKEKQEILQLWSKRSQELNLPSVLQENLDPSQITIYLDMDGVIADFDQRFQSLSGMNPTEFENTYGKQEFWDFIDEKHKIAFWVGIPVMGGAQQLVDYVSKYPYEILTAPSTKKQSLLGKNLWVKNHIDLFGSKPKINFKKAKNKHLVKPNLTKNDILIDDRADTIDRWNTAGGTGILYKSSSQVINDMKKLGL